MRLLLALLLTLFAVPALSAAAMAAPVIGQPAPAFTGKDTGGNERSLATYQGKVVVLEWTNHDCPYVKKHYDSRNMQELQQYAADNDVVWLRVISSAPGKQGHLSPVDADRLAQGQGVAALATLLDETGEIGQAYNAQTTPHMYVIDTTGTLVYAGAIDSKPTTDAADIKTAQNYVKTVLDDIKTGRPVSVAETKAYGCGVKYPD